MNDLVKTPDRIILTPPEEAQLFELGKLRWDEKDVAAIMGWPQDLLHKDMQRPDSEVRKFLVKGEMTARFEVERALYSGARDGDPELAIQFDRVMKDRSFRMTKLDLFGGAEDEKTFEDIQRYYQDGCPGDLSAKEQTYLEILQMVYSFEVQYGKRKTIILLGKEPYNLSRERAADLIAEAVEMFNGGRRVTKEAMRAHMADTYDTLYHAMIDSAATTKDYAMAASILEKKAKLLRLDQPDDVPVQKDEYQKRFRLVSLTPESIGLPAANRDELAAQIDALDYISERDARKLKMDAGIIDTDIIEILENVTQEES